LDNYLASAACPGVATDGSHHHQRLPNSCAKISERGNIKQCIHSSILLWR
jgi:hypothetical protein